MTEWRRAVSLDGLPPSSGLTALRKHLAGKRLTQRQAILAKCCNCMGYYRDGRKDCGMRSCALYPFMPYRSRESIPRAAGAITVAPEQDNSGRTGQGGG